MLSGSAAPNVLPAEVSAVINLRLLPGDSIAGVLRRLQRVVRDPAISITPLLPEGSSEPVPESPVDGWVYRGLQDSVTAAFPDAVIAPYLVTATTDSKHYRAVADAIYRFLPLPMGPAELAMIHGVDERIAITDYLRMIGFYRDLIQRLTGNSPGEEA